MSTPSLWPHIVIEHGPAIAGLEPGDAIAFAPTQLLTCNVRAWGRRFELHVSAREDHGDDGEEERRSWARRVMPEPARLELRLTTHADWSPVEPAQHVIDLAPWRVRVVLDGPPLASVKRFGPHLAARCTGIATASRYQGERDGEPEERSIFSTWILPAHGAARSLLVIERPSGEILHVVRPRTSGVPVFGGGLFTDGIAAMSRELGRIGGAGFDPEIAAGIAMQAEDDQSGVAYVGWDGVLRHLDDDRAQPYDYGCRARIFAWLLRLRDLEVAKATLATTRAASIAEVSAVVSALDPERSARDAAIVEECGVLAG